MRLVSRPARFEGALRLIGGMDGDGIEGRTAIRGLPIAVVRPLDTWFEVITVDRCALRRSRFCAAEA